MPLLTRARPTVRASVDAAGLTLPAGTGGILTVSLDDQYVWSLQPARDGRSGLVDGRRVVQVPWPEALAHLLRGRSRVLVRDHASGTPYVDDEVRFTAEDRRVRVVDKFGHPLAVNKVGHLTRVFSATDAEARREILTEVARVLADLREHGGVEAFLATAACSARSGRAGCWATTATPTSAT